jgi:ribosome-interacting GTPase 1
MFNKRSVIAVARTADLVLMMLDATKGPTQRYVLHMYHSPRFVLNMISELLEKELEAVGIRLNKSKPNIAFKVNG